MCTAQPRCRHSYKSFLGCKWFLFFELRDWVVYEERMDIFIHIPFNLLYTLFLCIVKPIGNYPSYGIIQFCPHSQSKIYQFRMDNILGDVIFQ